MVSSKKEKTILIIVVLFIALIAIGTKKIIDAPEPISEWQKKYRQSLIDNSISLEYVSSTSTLDFNTPDIQNAISSINPVSDEDALKKTTQYVLKNIKYNGRIPIDYCYAETATSALKSGVGDCVSMTKVGSAMLRGMGVAVKTAGGCLKSFFGCKPIMGTFPIEYMKSEIIDSKKRGYLHEWGEVWIMDKGWVLVDFTSGAIYDKGCDAYGFYSYDNADKINMCVINDNSFIEQCKG